MHTLTIQDRQNNTKDITDTFLTLGDAWNAALSFLSHPSSEGGDDFDRGYVNGIRDARYTGTIYTQRYMITVL